MNFRYNITITEITEIHTLPGLWPPHQLRELLDKLDMENIDAIDDSELLDYTLMALQEEDMQISGERVLEVVFGNSMSAGVRQNLVDDLYDDEPWQDFSNVAQQRGIFVAVVLLQQAFPNRYGTPDALRLTFSVQATAGATVYSGGDVTPAWLVRLLAPGMSDTDILHRLFSDQLAEGDFPEASGVLWDWLENDVGNFTVFSASQWLRPLRNGTTFSAKL